MEKDKFMRLQAIKARAVYDAALSPEELNAAELREHREFLLSMLPDFVASNGERGPFYQAPFIGQPLPENSDFTLQLGQEVKLQITVEMEAVQQQSLREVALALSAGLIKMSNSLSWEPIPSRQGLSFYTGRRQLPSLDTVILPETFLGKYGEQLVVCSARIQVGTPRATPRMSIPYMAGVFNSVFKKYWERLTPEDAHGFDPYHIKEEIKCELWPDIDIAERVNFPGQNVASADLPDDPYAGIWMPGFGWYATVSGKSTHDELEEIFSEAITHAIFYIVGVDVTK